MVTITGNRVAFPFNTPGYFHRCWPILVCVGSVSAMSNTDVRQTPTILTVSLFTSHNNTTYITADLKVCAPCCNLLRLAAMNSYSLSGYRVRFMGEAWSLQRWHEFRYGRQTPAPPSPHNPPYISVQPTESGFWVSRSHRCESRATVSRGKEWGWWAGSRNRSGIPDMHRALFFC